MATNVDRAVRGYVRTLERVAEQHRNSITAAEKRATDTRASAEEKLLTARQTYERAIERAEATLQDVRTSADAALQEAEQRAVEEFDREMRRITGAPSGARLVQAGPRLLLDLGDGHQPIAQMVSVGGGAWQVLGGEGPAVVHGDVVSARTALWERCRPTVHTVHATSM
jgi:hypothetical protein